MKWSQALATGIPEVDQQHRELIDRVNLVLAACQKRQGDSAMADTLGFLSDYVVEHFQSEEALQRQYGYPDYERHRQMHADFIATYSRLQERFNTEGVTLQLILELNKHLVDWLINHILREDKQLAQYIKNRD